MSFMNFNPHRLRDKHIEEGEVDGACSTHGGEEKMTRRSAMGNLEDGDRLLQVDVDLMIILKLF